MLEAEVQSKVLSLYFNEKKSIRQIAIIVEVDRKTVRRIIDRKKIHLALLFCAPSSHKGSIKMMEPFFYTAFFLAKYCFDFFSIAVICEDFSHLPLGNKMSVGCTPRAAAKTSA